MLRYSQTTTESLDQALTFLRTRWSSCVRLFTAPSERITSVIGSAGQERRMKIKRSCKVTQTNYIPYLLALVLPKVLALPKYAHYKVICEVNENVLTWPPGGSSRSLQDRQSVGFAEYEPASFQPSKPGNPNKWVAGNFPITHKQISQNYVRAQAFVK